MMSDEVRYLSRILKVWILFIAVQIPAIWHLFDVITLGLLFLIKK